MRGRGANGGETVTSRKKVFHEVDDERRKKRPKNAKGKTLPTKKTFPKSFFVLSLKSRDFSKKLYSTPYCYTRK